MKKQVYQWAVLGAGPAGIASVGKLIDSGVEASSIAWIDPQFTVGDFGALWADVSSNTSVRLFLQFFNECRSFDYQNAPQFDIDQFNPGETCQLKFAAQPLHWITRMLAEKVSAHQIWVDKISLIDQHWSLQTKAGPAIRAKNVILATGAEPHSLDFGDVKEIPITTALNKEKLKKAVEGKRKIAVIGSSHSAVILLRDLLDLAVENVMNFYLSPLCYAKFFDDWTMFDNTGLKGKAAEWARTNLQGNLPKGLERYLSTAKNLSSHFQDADAVIYATGFRRRKINVEGLLENFSYNQQCGIISPGLFGVGIGFPEKTIDRYGNEEFSVGLWKFMYYINKVMPLWLGYSL